ncbi:nuclear transport factor 2 family protein [Angustibacter aerolatus]|uniref:SnoaL-like domain-containing protein n=1 Tax=Angustibacter aerolatus TaxID=1162965 RepID=A0ABQ6JMA0_9ACTN|nr:nuclear transport factor 2 family protein [Angustibacter aerolatus]GMA87977.1 hypothetical protein GCM10025868_32270 [Angustibacter aerolatus]
MTDPTQTTTTLFEAWQRGDLDAVRGVLHDAVTFRGPVGSADGADACVAGLRGIAHVATEIRVLKVFTDGPDVLTWFDLHTGGSRPAPVAMWCHVEDGRIARIRATFDPKDLLARR